MCQYESVLSVNPLNDCLNAFSSRYINAMFANEMCGIRTMCYSCLRAIIIRMKELKLGHRDIEDKHTVRDHTGHRKKFDNREKNHNFD